MGETKIAMTTADSDQASADADHVEEIPSPHDGSGNVRRKLKSRHMQFYAIGGTIGTGLFVGIGSGLATGGPLSLLLGYTITGLAVFAMVRKLR